MSHPSIYELARFIEHGHESADFENHVQDCDACAARLSQLARRALVARGLAADAVVPSPPTPAVVPLLMAVFACVAVLVSAPTRAASLPSTPPVVFSSAELHGTPFPAVVTHPDLSGGDAGPGAHSD